jgi:hypothetical protein
LLIVGASARAAAFSALRAGFEPVCLDLYADADLAAVARALRVASFPEEGIDVLARWPDVPAIYVGAMENHGALIDALAARCWGTRGESSRRSVARSGWWRRLQKCACRAWRSAVPISLPRVTGTGSSSRGAVREGGESQCGMPIRLHSRSRTTFNSGRGEIPTRRCSSRRRTAVTYDSSG